MRLFGRPWTARTHLLWLVMLVMLPAAGLVLHLGRERQQEAQHRSRQNLETLMEDQAKQAQHRTDATRQLLATLSALPAVQDRNQPLCDGLFKILLEQNPRYTSLLATDPQGQAFAWAGASTPQAPPFSLADCHFFQDVLQTRGFVAGEFTSDRLTGKRALHFALPAFGPDQTLRAVLVAGLDLEELDRRHGLPGELSFTVMDHRGTFLQQDSPPPKPSTPAAEPWVAERPLFLPGRTRPYLTLRLAAFESSIMKEIRRDLAWNLGSLGLATLALGLLIWSLGDRLLARPLAESENRFREREALFRLIFERSADPNLLLDGEHFVDCNEAAVRYFGASCREEILQTRPWSLSPDHQPDGQPSSEKARQLISNAYQEGSLRFEWRHRHRDGHEIPTDVRLTAIPWKGHWVLYTTLLDLTERIQAEEERRNLELQMLQSQKLESLGLLAGGIAHDFNNLLTAIMGNLNLAQGAAEEGHPGLPFLQKAERIVQKAADLTKQMLAYSGRGRFLVKAHDLNAVAREMTNLLQVTLPKKVDLRFDLAAHLPTVEADAGQIQQVIMNLVTNAGEAIGDTPGTITLSTGQTWLETGDISDMAHGEGLQPGPCVYLEVRDTGCGIPPEALSRIFDPFYTTKKSGRGLGLAAMLGILRGHRAGIHIESEPGIGSCFRVCFPRGGAALLPEPEAPLGDLENHRGSTILLVDDEPAVRQSTQDALEQAGFRVICAGDGLEAVHQFRASADGVDLVVMDLTMPRMDGREAFQHMRALRPEVRVILCSGYDEGDSLGDLGNGSPDAFLQKPYRIQDLRQAVARALAREALSSPAL